MIQGQMRESNICWLIWMNCKFEQFKRSHDMNMKDYINAFDHLNNRLIEYDMKLPEGVLAVRLLKGAHLSPDTENWLEQL